MGINLRSGCRMLENLCPSSNGLDQFASLQLVAPPEELVRVHTVGPCHLRYACTRLQRQLR